MISLTGDLFIEITSGFIALAVSYELTTGLTVVTAYSFNSDMRLLNEHQHKHSNPFECMQFCIQNCLKDATENV